MLEFIFMSTFSYVLILSAMKNHKSNEQNIKETLK